MISLKDMVFMYFITQVLFIIVMIQLLIIQKLNLSHLIKQIKLFVIMMHNHNHLHSIRNQIRMKNIQ